jgi:nitroreductase
MSWYKCGLSILYHRQEEGMLRDLIRQNRSYRRFDQQVPIGPDVLRQLVELARLSASGANMQPLKYLLVADRDACAHVFPSLGWAAYLKDWKGPGEGERPAAYIVILGDRAIRKEFGVDHGIAAQSIMLGAAELGLGGCIIASIKRPALRASFSIPEEFEILLCLALGKPKEMVVIEPVGPDGDIRYFRDSEGIHHVPKRSLDDLIWKSV